MATSPGFPQKLISVLSGKKFYWFLVILTLGSILVSAVWSRPDVYNIFKVTVPHFKAVKEVAFTSFNGTVILLILIAYLTTFMAGFGVFEVLFPKVKAPAALRFFGSFPFGYLLVIAIARFSTIFVSPKNSYFLVLFLAGVLTACFSLTQKQEVDPMESQGIDNPVQSLLVGYFGVLILVMALFLQVYQADFVWVGHGQYADTINKWMQENKKWVIGGSESKFPIILQHYDELIYHYWLSMPLRESFNHLIVWWVTLAIMKSSSFVLLFIMFKEISKSFAVSLAISLFVLFGTMSPLFDKYFMSFDCSSPLFYVAHSGRIYGFIAPFLMMWFLLRKGGSASPENPKQTSWAMSFFAFLAGFLMAVGLSSTTISNILWILFLIFGLVFLRYRERLSGHAGFMGGNPDSGVGLVFPHLAYLAAFALPVLMYGFTEHNVAIARLSLLVAFTGLILLAGVGFFSKPPPVSDSRESNLDIGVSPQKSFVTWGVIAGSVVACLVLGNIVAAPLAGGLFKSSIYSKLEVDVISLLLTFVSEHMTGAIKDVREIGDWSKYNQSTPGFIAYYGNYYLFALVAIIGLRTFEEQKVEFISQRNGRGLLFLVSAILMLLPAVYVFIDFFDFGERSWIKTRFLEVPLNFIAALALIIFANCQHRFLRVCGVVLMVLYMVGPIVGTDRLMQIFLNIYYLWYI